jgi:anthranilate synthase component 1
MSPDPAEFASLARRYQVVPVWRELLADISPVGLFARLGAAEGSVLLEHGGVSYLGLDPITTLLVRDGAQSWTNGPICPVPAGGSLLDTLSAVAGALRAPDPAGLPWSPAGGFCVLGGDAPAPDGAVVFPGAVIAVDHAARRLRLVVNVRIEPGRATTQYAQALTRLDELAARLAEPAGAALAPVPAAPPEVDFDAEIPDDTYRAMIEAAHRRVVAGELRQVTVSRRFHAPATVDPLATYRTLRVTNPSPYHYLARLPGVTLVGASPQGLVRVRGRDVTTHVIAGTRPRGEDTAADDKLAAELLADPKEREEHAMLVELARADLVGVAAPGTVRVVDGERVVRYSTVMHLVTDVAGALAPGRTALAALSAVYPPGTVAGLPREAALRVIAEVEPRRRGLYGGAVGLLDLAGNLDLCLGIRVLESYSGTVYCQAGAGVVAGSVADAEVAESRNKARALFVALAAAARV